MQIVNEFFRLGAKFQKEQETQMNFWQELTDTSKSQCHYAFFTYFFFPFSWEECFFILCLELSLSSLYAEGQNLISLCFAFIGFYIKNIPATYYVSADTT